MGSTLFINGHIYSLNNDKECFSYLGIKKDKIVYLGNHKPKETYTHIVDLKGKYIFPSLTDSHLHLLYSIVLSTNSFNVCEVKMDGVYPNTLSGVKERITQYISHNKKLKLIVGNNYIPSAIEENRLPNRYELDEWGKNKEVIIMNIDGHSASLSTSLLKKLNLFSESSDGILKNKEYDFVSNKITDYIASKVSLSTLINGVYNFENECIKYGLGEVCALEGNDDSKNDVQMKLITFISRRLSLDVRLFPQYHDINKCKKLFKKMTYPRMGGCNKWELDGSVGSNSASFYENYLNGSLSNTYFSDDYVMKKVHEITSQNIQFTAHAIGTRAIDQLINSYKHTQKSKYINRIDHFEFPSLDAISEASTLNLAVTIQPGYSYIDKRYLHSYERNLSKNVINMQVPLKTCAEKNILLLGSSDSPVQSINPYLQMAGMIDFYIKEQSLSNFEALKTYTVNPAIVLNENNSGTLKVGNLANFIVTSFNFLETDAKAMLNAYVETLYLRGRIIKKHKHKYLFFFKILLKKPKLI